MGAVLGALLPDPLTGDCNARLCPTRARGRKPLCSATGRVRANAAAFAVRRVHGQVYWRARSGPQATAEYKRKRGKDIEPSLKPIEILTTLVTFWQESLTHPTTTVN